MKAAEFDAGHCAVELPAVREAFERGDLSLEKVRLISTVANEESQDEWVGQAMRTTPGQLARHAREARTPGRDDPEGDRLQRSLRHLNYRNDEIGMLRICGALPKTDGHASAPSIIRACIAGSGGSSAPRREICSSSGGMVSLIGTAAGGWWRRPAVRDRAGP